MYWSTAVLTAQIVPLAAAACWPVSCWGNHVCFLFCDSSTVWFRGRLHTVHSLRSVRSTTVWHVTAETSWALSSHFYRNNHRSLSQLCVSEPVRSFEHHLRLLLITVTLTCWQHSETHSWRNNCKLLQNESCCTWRCLWYKCLQTWTVSRCCSAPVPVSAHRTSLASYLHSCRARKGLKKEPTAPLTDREQDENCKCANRNQTVKNKNMRNSVRDGVSGQVALC